MAKTAYSKQRLLTGTLKPTAAVTRCRFVGADGNQLAVLGAKASGVAYDSWTAEDIAIAARDLSGNAAGMGVTILGFDELEVDAAIATIGTELTSDATGRGKTAVATNYVNAILYSASTAAGDRVMALILAQPYIKP